VQRRERVYDLAGLAPTLTEECTRIEHEIGRSLRLTVLGLDPHLVCGPERVRPPDRT